jgi:hypothetical protein
MKNILILIFLKRAKGKLVGLFLMKDINNKITFRFKEKQKKTNDKIALSCNKKSLEKKDI